MSRKPISYVSLLLIAFLLMPMASRASEPAAPLTTNVTTAPLDLKDTVVDVSAAETAAAEAGYGPDDIVPVFVQLPAKPAALVWKDTIARQSPAAAKSAAQRQAASIAGAQAVLLPQIQKLGGKPMYQLQGVLNVIAVRIAVRDIPRLKALPGVKQVGLVPIYKIENASGVSLIGAPQLWDAAGGINVKGDGIKVGVIDTGIDYLHTGFGGSGLAADYTNNNTTVITDNMGFPNAKVVGGWDFAGNDYNADPASPSYQPVAHPDPDPMDCNGHGSHVSGTTAGYGVNADGTTYTGPWDATSVPTQTMRIGPGVAPKAQLYALRVFGCAGSTDLVEKAFEWAADPNHDLDFSDHLDVVNLSLGSSYGSNDASDLSAQAANNTAQVGTIVVTSAGNSGDYTYISGSPGSADWSIATASSVDAQSVFNAFIVNSPPAIAGQHPASLSANYSWATKPSLTANLYYPLTNRGACAAFSPAESALITGTLVLIDWTLNPGGVNECGSAVRANNAAAAGAKGAIMVWPATGIDISIAGNATIPAIITNKPTGDALKAALLTGAVNATLSDDFPGAVAVNDPTFVDSLSSFSSRGPRRGNMLKPDLAAPGQTIFSVANGTGNVGTSLNGTSMASPHVAGSMALLRQLHPTWSVEELKALIMNTASVQTRVGGATGLPYSPVRQGAGRVVLPKAADSKVVAYNDTDDGLVSVSFGAPQVVGSGTYTKTVRVVNKGLTPMTYNLSITDVVTAAGVLVTPSVNSITVAAGGSSTFDVLMTINANQLDRTIDPTLATSLLGNPRHFLNEHTGYVVLTPTTPATPLHVAYYAAPRPASAMGVSEEAIHFENTNAMTLTLQGPDVSTSAYKSLVTALELQEISPLTGTIDMDASADLKYIGVGSSISNTGTLQSGTSIYFGIATHAAWSLPILAEVGFYVVIDTNRDGNDDYILYNNYFTTATASANDVLVTKLFKFSNSSTTTIGFVNVASSAVTTEPMNSSVLVLPVTAGALGLTAGNSRFNYRVESIYRNIPGDYVDFSATHSFDPAAPALNASKSTLPFVLNSPIHYDINNTQIGLVRNPASWAADQPLGLLALHHLNQVGQQAEAVPMRALGVSTVAETSAASGLPGATVTHSVTITNTGNVQDTFLLDVTGDEWTATAPASVVIAAGASATVEVDVAVPANALAGASDSATLTITSQTDNSVSDSVSLTTTAQAVYAVDASAAVTTQTAQQTKMVTYTVTVVNNGNIADTFNITLGSHTWTSSLSASTVGPLAPGASATVKVMVTVPANVAYGAAEALTVTVTSAGSAAASDTVILTTRSGTHVLYLPAIRK
jgi:subtilisin family serine protease